MAPEPRDAADDGGVRIPVGGMDRLGIVDALDARGIQRNALAETLLASLDFEPIQVGVLSATERSVADLGFVDGATLAEILASAQERGLHPFPIEAAPYLAMVIEAPIGSTGTIASTGSAPVGSLTIAAQPPSVDSSFPTGFYLRALDGTRWLRGFRCDADHRFAPGDRFLFRAI